MLTELRGANWWLVASLYVSQFLGLGFFFVALVGVMLEVGISAEQLGLLFLLGMSWGLKFLWAPLIERWSWARWGHFRFWLLTLQGAMVVLLLGMSLLVPQQQFALLCLLFAVFAFCSASQDIALDGLICRWCTGRARQQANVLQGVGGLVGNGIGGAGVLLCYPYLGWQGSLCLLAAGVAIGWVQLCRLEEPRHAGEPLALAGYYARIWSFWQQRTGWGWLCLVLLFPLGASMAYVLLTPLLLGKGWQLAMIGSMQAGVGTLFGVAGAALGGVLLRRYSAQALLVPGMVLQGLGVLLLWLLGEVTLVFWLQVLLIGLFFLPISLFGVLLGTRMMELVSPESAATDYALQQSVYMLAGILAAAAGSWLQLQLQLGLLDTLLLCAGSSLLLVAFVYGWERRSGGQAAQVA